MASLLDGLVELYVCIGIGFAAGRLLQRRGARGPVERVLTWVVINAITPVLVFTSLVKNAVNIPWQNVASTVAVMVGTSLGSLLIAYLAFRGRSDMTNARLGGYLLIAGWANATFFPLPIVLTVYGTDFLIYPVLYASTSLVLRGTLATYICIKLGVNSTEKISARKTIKALITFPPTLAIAIALAYIAFGIPYPQAAFAVMELPITKASSWLGAVTIGMFLNGVDITKARELKHDIPRSLLFRFAIPLAIFVPMAFILPVVRDETVVKTILLLEVLSPPAIINTLFAAKFQLDKELVAMSVVVLTLLMIFLAPAILLAGAVVFA